MVSVLTESELENQEAELSRRMNETRDKKTQTAGALAEAKREVDHFRDSYEIVLAEDKALDKAFKKEFADQDAHTVEQLYKLFKRRPRWEGQPVCDCSVLNTLNYKLNQGPVFVDYWPTLSGQDGFVALFLWV